MTRDNEDRGSNNPPPTVDPTVLTTQALTREITAVREVIEQKITALSDVQKEKFRAVAQQFTLIERGRKEQKEDTKAAVGAALSAAKEAVKEQTTASEKSITKSETATSELLKQLNNTLTTEASALRREIGEVKDRVTALENQRLGAKEDRTALYATIGVGVTVLVAILSVVGIAISR